MKLKRGLLGFGFLVLTVAGGAESAMAQQNGSVSGRVVDAQTDRPLASARVFAVGTNASTVTDQDGSYLLPNVAAGPQQVRATLLGYSQGAQQVVVAVGETETANFSLSVAAISLDGLVVTATGEQRQREIPNTVTTIQASDIVESAPITNLSDLLNSRAAGVTVSSGSGDVATSSRIRLRGWPSASSSDSAPAPSATSPIECSRRCADSSVDTR